MKETMADKIYWDIKKDINNLVFDANEFLVEKDIAKRYAVSKAPVREAVHRLCQEGQLISHPRKGYAIVTINHREFDEIQQLRLINESRAIELAVEKASEQAIAGLYEIIKKTYDVNNNMEFHTRLAHLSGNKFLEDIVVKLLGVMSRSLSMVNVFQNTTEIARYHREIVDALIKRDAATAKEWLKKDLNLLFD